LNARGRSPSPSSADLNGLKTANDELGYAVGDTLLRRAGEVFGSPVDNPASVPRIRFAATPLRLRRLFIPYWRCSIGYFAKPYNAATWSSHKRASGSFPNRRMSLMTLVELPMSAEIV
jgi:hypothetical protein